VLATPHPEHSEHPAQSAWSEHVEYLLNALAWPPMSTRLRLPLIGPGRPAPRIGWCLIRDTDIVAYTYRIDKGLLIIGIEYKI
jgi:hypothetical protein